MTPTESDGPGRMRLLLMLVVAGVALGAGWIVVYAVYRYLASGWQ